MVEKGVLVEGCGSLGLYDVWMRVGGFGIVLGKTLDFSVFLSS